MKSTFTRRGPDRVAEELAAVLSQKASFEFKPLFTLVHAALRARDAASGGEEMLRLRTYERLQTFVQAGYVSKTGKEYRGIPAGLKAFHAKTAEMKAHLAAATHPRPPAKKASAN